MTGAAKSELTVQAKVWVEREGHVVISDFLASLLELIGEHGSLAAAAAALGLPNRTAWKKLREMEGAAGVALVNSASGGSGGGGTRLTPAGAGLLAAFRRVADPSMADVRDRFAQEIVHFPGSGCT